MSSHTLASKFFRNATGAILAEFALIFPFILVFTVGALEIGLFLFEASAAAKATQLGARWAVVNLPISSSFQTELAATDWWQPGTLGKSCRAVACEPSKVFQCTEGTVGCDMTGILAQMQRAYPQLRAGNIRVTYEPYPTSRALGFVGRPGGVPVDVTVSIRCRVYTFAFLANWFDWVLPGPEAGCNTDPGIRIPTSTTRLSSESFGFFF